MGFLGKLFEKKEAKPLVIAAPLAGEVVPVTQVDDPTFGQELLGQGIAIRPTGNQVVAPFDGTVEMMFDTGHAVSLKSAQGVEVLIHVGIDTVELKGQHYQAHVASGDRVKQGQLLITFDPEGIVQAGYQLITPVVVCNSDECAAIQPHLGQVAPGAPVLTVTK